MPTFLLFIYLAVIYIEITSKEMMQSHFREGILKKTFASCLCLLFDESMLKLT